MSAENNGHHSFVESDASLHIPTCIHVMTEDMAQTGDAVGDSLR